MAVLIPIALVGALVFNAMRYDSEDSRDRPNGYMSVQPVTVSRPVDVVFDFVQAGIAGIYTRMSPMHERYDILNADAPVVGAEEDCLEGDPNQIMHHHYVVTDAVAPRLRSTS